MAEFSIIIEGDRLFSKKNSRPIHLNKRTGRRFIGKSRELQSYENMLMFYLKKRAQELNIEIPMKGRLELWIAFNSNKFFKKDGTLNKNQPDLDNLLCAPLDALQRAGIIENDNQIFHITALKQENSKTCIDMSIKQM